MCENFCHLLLSLLIFLHNLSYLIFERHYPSRWENISLWIVKHKYFVVTVFIIFTLYVSLVASIASLYNCTAPIEGKAYLVADLTVICYEGLHVAFLIFASVGAIVFAIGIPIAVALAVTLRSPCFRENGTMKFECRRRTPEEYTSASMRSRFAFLFNGESM